MRYIRTKDGKIFSVLVSDQVSKDEAAMDIIGFRIQTALKQNKCIAKKDNILKIANTIEELCDEFIVENPEKDIHERCCDLQDVFNWVDDQEIPIGIKKFDEERDLISGHHDWSVYGAIWTDKGLQFVARMNSKGKLELL